ncbi:hypothetical protein OTK49_26725 [Vibrio coralliirubri]|uniref:hypothetical protein n=1 Tax=Vibrio coralliirubri TaxID=1516159 RepID=UPI002284DDB3|nr:hypothetical protein [Vibrio coralliirubri]MCY9866136.1 hypothetical protein [Vibrio coralliirubri]
MKSLSVISAALLAAIAGGAYAQAEESNERTTLTTKDLDSLNSEEHYWKKVSSIETAKSQAIQLQIQNLNLQKAAGVKSEATGDGASPKLIPSDGSSGDASVSDLKSFIRASLVEQSVISSDEASEQEDIIAANSDLTLPSNMETAGVVDSRGKIQSSNQSTNDMSDKYIEEQGKFMQQLAKFLDEKLKSAPQPQIVIPTEAEATSQQQLEPIVEEPRIDSSDNFVYEPTSPFYKPTGKIKKVTPNGVEVVLAYDWIDYDEDTVFASTVIKSGDKEVLLYPMVRHVHKYSVKSFSDKLITLVDSTGYEIAITR